MNTRQCVLLCITALCVVPSYARAQQKPEGVRVTSTGIMLDFQDTDLRLVIAALGEAGGLNVVYAELPAKRVTLRTTLPVEKSQVPALLRSLAASNGMVVTEEGGFFRIDVPVGPSQDARQSQSAGKQEDARLFVYRLKHARAVRLAATLQSLFGGPAASYQSGFSRPSLSQGLRQQRIPPMDSVARPKVEVTVGAVQTGLPGQLQGDVQIVPDEATNSLLVRAQPDDWQIVQQAAQALDLRPLQVLIEVIIAEVRRDRDLNAGVSAKANNRSGDRSGELKTTASNDFLLRLRQTGKIDIDIALAALSSSGRVRILSRPVVLAQNNQEARILVGSERPFVQVFRSLPTDAAVRDQVVQYRDVGTSLTILPTINPDGYVNLQVSQEVSTATNETQFGAPIISTREASTHLLARNGQTVVIGGLVDHQQDHARSGIPGLKEIPLIGALFGTTRISDRNSELFLFLTPHVVETDEDADRLRDGAEHRDGLMRELSPIKPLLTPVKPDSAGVRK
ncbi:MAG: type II secretion system protein GspD [Gemmatimonadota bacterium]